MLICVVACCLISGIPFCLVFEFPLTISILLTLTNTPIVTISRECLVGSDGDIILFQANHFARQSTVVNSNITIDIRTLHIFYSEVDGICIDTWHLAEIVITYGNIFDIYMSVSICSLLVYQVWIYFCIFTFYTILNIICCAFR